MANPSQEPQSSQPTFGVINNLDTTPKHPWKRYFARMIDNLLMAAINMPFFIVLAVVVGLASDPGKMGELASNYFFACIITIVSALEMTAAETFLLATWGTTPGKRLLGMKVSDANGEKLSFQAALKRSAVANGCFMVASLLPLGTIFNIVLLIFQRRQLMKTGYTTWDQLQQSQVGPV